MDLENKDPIPNEEIHWYNLESEEVIERLETSTTEGLSTEEAQRRVNTYGENKLREAPPTSFLQLLWAQFNDFVIWLLIGAAIISAILGEWVEAGAILAIVLLNAVLGIVQERRAEEALAALKKLAAPEANVIRDGHRLIVPAAKLVPGDVVILEAGNFIPADIRLVTAVNLKIEEAALTGESVPVQKVDDITLKVGAALGDRKNSAFMGTLVSYGRGVGIVTDTGMGTQIGQIAEMLQAVEDEQTPLQKKLDQLGKTLGWAALSVCGLVFLVGLLRNGFSQENVMEMFLISISLAIAAVPEGLPAVVTISLALGMREMIDRNALIRRLSSVETLGSATVIGSDKTGTLTQNEMTVTQISIEGADISVSGIGYTPKGEFLVDDKPIKLSDYPSSLTALWVGALNNDAILEQGDEGEIKMIGDPTEGSIIVAAAKADKNYQALSKAYPRVQEIPFDSTRKRMTTIHEVVSPHSDDPSPFTDDDPQKGNFVVAVKGAPDVVLDLCKYHQHIDDKPVKLNGEIRERIKNSNNEMASDALRVIAVAYKVIKKLPAEITSENLESELIFAGLVGMIDPPRPEVKAALEIGQKAGIRTVMITGDYAQTAKAIADSIGLRKPGDRVITGEELNTMSDTQLREDIEYTSVFARVSPEHKVRIVRALRSNGEIVAMTGDGVNDAPALKQADIGVAMGITGTDVAKETADMVLTDDNYSSIVSAIEQGRIIYSNIRKFVFYLLSCNLAEIAVIFLAILFKLPSPLNPIQLLWLNLVTDGAPALALGMEKGDPDTMDQKPRPSDEPIINKQMQLGIVIQTVAITAITLGAYLIGLKLWPTAVAGEFNTTAATMAFITLSMSELLRAFTARSERYPLTKLGFFKNKTMNWAVLASTALLLMAMYVPFLQPIFETVPLGWAQWQYVLPLLLIPALAAETTKWFISKKGN